MITKLPEFAVNLNKLNSQVTRALFAFDDVVTEVSLLEEQIASITDPSSVEGRIARRGAIRMAIHARDGFRANALMLKFCEESGYTSDFAKELIHEFSGPLGDFEKLAG